MKFLVRWDMITDFGFMSLYLGRKGSYTNAKRDAKRFSHKKALIRRTDLIMKYPQADGFIFVEFAE